MAHENNKHNGKSYKAVVAVSKALNKKGKIKGKNKKETKYLNRACTHHYINKKGKEKPAIFNNSNGECICELCGRSFQTKPETKEEVRNKLESALSLANQVTFAAVAGHLGEKAVDKFVNLKVLLEEFPKDYSRTMKAVSKEDNIKKKKKKKNNGGGGSSQYGDWNNKK
jgi:hypothetical protein